MPDWRQPGAPSSGRLMQIRSTTAIKARTSRSRSTAARCFSQLEPFSPHVALAYGRRGEAYVHKGDLDRAIADFDQAIASIRARRGSCVGRGLAYREHGDLDSALADFSKAIEIDSASPTPSSIAASPMRTRGKPISRSRIAPPLSPSIRRMPSPITIAALPTRRPAISTARLPTIRRPSSSTPAIASAYQPRRALRP